jgi:hypothetical protein
MHFQYIDIGTSNFKTSLKYKKIGELLLLVEPLQFYLNDFPDDSEIIKANYAVSNIDSTTTIFYVHPKNIEKYGLPMWFKGCNSIDNYHPTVKAYLFKVNVPLSIVDQQRVEVISFKTLIKKFNVMSVTQLQIDTEGHDHIILGNVLECIKEKRCTINKIIVEWEPSFNNTPQIETLIREFCKIGYNDLGYNKNNRIIARL